MITQAFTIDLVPGFRPQARQTAQQGDKGGSRVFSIAIETAGQSFTIPDQATVVILGTKPSGTGFAYDTDSDPDIITKTETGVTVALAAQMTCVPGDVVCGLIIKLGAETLGSASFVMDVHRRALAEDTIIDRDDFSSALTAAVWDLFNELTEEQAAQIRDKLGIHDGGGSSTVIVTIDDTTDPPTASMTAGQIKSAVDSGSVVKMLNGNIFFDCVSANAYLSTFAIALESSIHTCLVTASGTVTTVQLVDIPSKTSDLTNDSGFVEKVTVTVDDTVDPPVASMNAVQIKNAVDSGKTVELDFRGSKLRYAFATEFAAVFGSSCSNGIVTCFVSTSGRVEFSNAQIPSLSGYATETWVQNQGYQTASDVQTAISTAVSGKADKTPRVAMASTDTTATIDPNKLYVFPEMASLTITLAAPADLSIVNEYHFIFSSGATATVLTLPDDLIAPDGELVTETSWKTEANQTYEVSILEGRMLEQHWGYVEVTA